MPVDIRSSLNKALRGLESERSRIEGQISALTDALSAIGGSGRGRTAIKSSGRRSRRAMSAAQKRAVSKRMKAYWAARRKTAK